MMKRFLCGVMAVALAASTLVVAPDASAAKVPKAKYTFNMDKANKNVVAVARKGDTDNFTTCDPDNGVLPDTKTAKKVKLKYAKGKNKKALYLDRSSSYGAQLKGVKLGSGSWTVAFWVKSANTLTSYMPIFFTGNKIADPKNTHWVAITRSGDGWTNGFMSPVIWSHAVKSEKEIGWPWYGYQNKDGEWVGSDSDKKSEAIAANKWVHITLVVDAKDRDCAFGEEGADNYYAGGYHGWTYVNGKLFGNGAVAEGTMSNSNSFFLGINAWDTPFKGYFDDVKLWNKALTAKQVKKVYKSK